MFRKHVRPFVNLLFPLNQNNMNKNHVAAIVFFGAVVLFVSFIVGGIKREDPETKTPDIVLRALNQGECYMVGAPVQLESNPGAQDFVPVQSVDPSIFKDGNVPPRHPCFEVVYSVNSIQGSALSMYVSASSTTDQIADRISVKVSDLKAYREKIKPELDRLKSISEEVQSKLE